MTNIRYLPSAYMPSTMGYIMREDAIDGMMTGAIFSRDELHRYVLWRFWDMDEKPLVVIGLNPSTATEKVLDPTIKRCLRRAQEHGPYGGLVMLNINSYRSTNPQALYRLAKEGHADEATGDVVHDRWLRWYTKPRYTDAVLCAWGTHGAFQDRGNKVLDMLRSQGSKVYYLQLNKDGSPKHPLYIANNCEMKELV